MVSLTYFDYKREVENLKTDIFAQMRLCSFDLKCPKFELDFEQKSDVKPIFLYENSDGLVSYFQFLNQKDRLLSIKYPIEKFNQEKIEVLSSIAFKFLLYEIILAFISFLFSYYSLKPIKNALITIEEFIKDILHDVNTPITTIALNSALLVKDEKNSKKIEKINKAIKKIVSIQDNLKSYLAKMPTQEEEFDLRELIIEQKSFTASIYPNIKWKINNQTIRLKTNRELILRIISNLISNAAKYNKRDGEIIITIIKNKNILLIEDTGKGIKNPSKVFERFYKEGERGTGIGLHIVKKFCNELGIKIDIRSELDRGTIIRLNLSKVSSYYKK